MSDNAAPILSREEVQDINVFTVTHHSVGSTSVKRLMRSHETLRDRIAELESEQTRIVATISGMANLLGGEASDLPKLVDDIIASEKRLTEERDAAQLSSRDSQRLLNELNSEYGEAVSALRAELATTKANALQAELDLGARLTALHLEEARKFRSEIAELTGKLEAAERSSASGMVTEFHETYNVPVCTSPAFPSHGRCTLRENILEEEWIELCEAQSKRDMIEVADALADMLYIIHGTALEYGIPLDAVVAEVHRSNMSKLGSDGKPIIRDDGKVMKGPNYFRPEIARILDAAMQPATSTQSENEEPHEK